MSATLTPRQLDCLRLAALGLRNAQIAAVLCLSVSTVKNHMSDCYDRLGVPNRAAAVVAFWRMEGAR